MLPRCVDVVGARMARELKGHQLLEPVAGLDGQLWHGVGLKAVLGFRPVTCFERGASWSTSWWQLKSPDPLDQHTCVVFGICGVGNE